MGVHLFFFGAIVLVYVFKVTRVNLDKSFDTLNHANLSFV